MSKEVWESLPADWRESVKCLFKMQNIDFEKTFIQKESQKISEESSPWMTRKEAAEYAGVSTDTIDNWLKAGKVKYTKLADGRPGAVRIDRKSLYRFLNSKVKANPDRRVRETFMKGAGYRVN